MAKSQNKSNREVRKPKKAEAGKAAGKPAGYLAAGMEKPFKLDAKPKKK